MGVGEILNQIGDAIQRRAAEAAFNSYAPSVAAFLDSNTEVGALFVFRFTQQVTNPSREGSFIRPVPKFRSLDVYYGRTEREAELRWKQAWKLDVDRTQHVAPHHSRRWIPPLARASETPRRRAERHPVTAEALLREIRVDLKATGNFLRIFHHLNGSSMVQMLYVLNELRRVGQLEVLANNFDKAQGVNRGRIEIAIRATRLRGTPEAFKIFMADENNRIELSGLEAEGRTAIERVLLTNRNY